MTHTCFSGRSIRRASFLPLCLLPMLVSGLAHAATVPSFNTGVNNDGSFVALGGTDPHWTIVGGPGVTSPQAAFVLTSQRNPLGTYYATNDSQWIWATADGVAGVNAAYTFELKFDLTGFDYTTASVSGSWGVDNLGSIQLNGAPAIGTGALVLSSSSTGNFTSPNAFSITGGFHAGINTIDIQATDQGFVGGMDVTALFVTATPTPEPGTAVLSMLGGAMLSVTALRRRRLRR